MKNTNWVQRNSLELNQEYVEKVLDKFELEKYCFVYNNGELALIIENNLKKYKIILDKKFHTMNVLRCEVHNNFTKHNKENYKLKVKFKEDCIWYAIKWVSKDSKLK